VADFLLVMLAREFRIGPLAGPGRRRITIRWADIFRYEWGSGRSAVSIQTATELNPQDASAWLTCGFEQVLGDGPEQGRSLQQSVRAASEGSRMWRWESGLSGCARQRDAAMPLVPGGAGDRAISRPGGVGSDLAGGTGLPGVSDQ